MMAAMTKWDTIVGDHGWHQQKNQRPLMIFKPASHRTSMTIDNVGGHTATNHSIRLNGSRSCGSIYKCLPKELRDSVVPLRKKFPEAQKALQERAECQSKTSTSCKTHLPKLRALQCDDWKKRAAAKKAKFEAAKRRFRRNIVISGHHQTWKNCSQEETEPAPKMENEADISKESTASDDSDSSKRSTSSKDFVTIVCDDASIVMVNSLGDRNTILRRLVERISCLLPKYEDVSDTSQGTAAAVTEPEDLYIDDDDILTSENLSKIRNMFSYLLTSSSEATSSFSTSGPHSEISSIRSGVETDDSTSKDSRSDDLNKKLVVSIPAEVGYSSSIQVHANYKGIRGKHLITTSYKSLQTGDTRTARRVVSASSVVSQIRVPQHK